MHKIVVFLLVVALAAVAYASEPVNTSATTELRPLQKIMQARAAWMKSMVENLAAKKFEAVAKDAEALAAQTKKVGEGAPNPLAKELNLKISGLAKTAAEAAAKKDADTLKSKLGEIKATCGECHARIRDKK